MINASVSKLKNHLCLFFMLKRFFLRFVIFSDEKYCNKEHNLFDVEIVNFSLHLFIFASAVAAFATYFFYMIEIQLTLMMFSCMYNLFAIHQIKMKIISRRGKSINIYNDRNWVTVISGQNIWEEKTSCIKSLIYIITVGCRRHGTCVCM